MKRFFYLLAACFMLGVTAFGKTHRVGKNQQYRTITAAIAEAQNGDTVLVEKGVYTENNIVVDKSIVLKGIDHPVLDGQKKFEVVSIKANKVVVDGFKVIRSGHSSIDDLAGIKIVGASHVTIINNILDDNFWGIYSEFGSNCVIKNNKIVSYGKSEQLAGNGIHCWKSDNLQIIGNNIQGHRDGIYFEFVTNSIIYKNVSTKNIRYGLHFMFSHNDSYIGNLFKQNGAGVAVMYTRGVKMFNNRFEENWGESAYGLLLKDISDSYLQGNQFVKNTIAINMEGSSRIEVEKNEFLQNGWALKIQASCVDNNFKQNNFIGNTFDIGTNGSLNLNTFNRNYWSKYEGYDLNKDRIGDIPFRPVSIFSMIVENNPPAMMLFRSFMVTLLDKTEKILPGITPDIQDEFPLMSPLRL